MAFPAGAVIGAGADLLGGALGFASAKALSNTAHQREVRDLRAAGLNPILSALGGPGASSPPVPDFGSVGSTVQSGRRLSAELKVLDHQKNLVEAQAGKAAADRYAAEAYNGMTRGTVAKGSGLEADIQSAKALRDRQLYENVGLANEARARSTKVGRNIVPWVDMLSRSMFGPAVGAALGRFSAKSSRGESKSAWNTYENYRRQR